MSSREPIKVGDRVELFAVYPDKWISRGDGIVHSFIGDNLARVDRVDAHSVFALTKSSLYGTVMVKGIPRDRFCQCLLPSRGI